MTGEITLFPHQAEAVDAIVAGLEIRPGQQIPNNGLRGQVHAACGTGKTFIAAGAAQRISPHGRVLVFFRRWSCSRRRYGSGGLSGVRGRWWRCARWMTIRVCTTCGCPRRRTPRSWRCTTAAGR
ncbi:DEAD/DEAH box helicase family protein [Streptomyces parvus]